MRILPVDNVCMCDFLIDFYRLFRSVDVFVSLVIHKLIQKHFYSTKSIIKQIYWAGLLTAGE